MALERTARILDCLRPARETFPTVPEWQPISAWDGPQIGDRVLMPFGNQFLTTTVTAVQGAGVMLLWPDGVSGFWTLGDLIRNGASWQRD